MDMFFYRFYEGAPLHESNSNLRLSNLSSDDSGSYRCRATNDVGSIFSSEANLKVIPGKMWCNAMQYNV